MIKLTKNRLGFTMIELLVVVTIIAVLSAVGLVIFTNSARSSRDAKRKADLEAVRQALVLYRSDNSCYPNTLDMSNGSPLTDDGYISSPFPKDPQSPDKDYIYTPGTTTVTCKDGSSGVSSFDLSATMENELPGGGTTYTISNP